MQDEMIIWLWQEREAVVSQSTISRLCDIGLEKSYDKSLDRSESFRRLYLEDITRYTAEDQLVFLDKTILNNKRTG
jgi:hypothetical protein